MKTFLFLIGVTALISSGCVPFNYNATRKIYRDEADIRNGILISGQPMKRFRSVWGNPTKTFSRRFDTGAKSNVTIGLGGGGGSFVANSRETYDVWFYQEKETTLVFRKQELVYWSYGPNPPTDDDFKPKTIN